MPGLIVMSGKLRSGFVQPLARARLMSLRTRNKRKHFARCTRIFEDFLVYLLLGQQRGGGGSCAEGWAGN